MTDLIEFLRARLDEDERAARAAAETFGGSERWRFDHFTDDDYGTTWFMEIADRVIVAGLPGDDDLPLRIDELRHASAHDPVRVLREVEAKRAIMAEHAPRTISVYPNYEETACGRCGMATEYPVDYPCDTLHALALPFADHPDFNPQWRISEVGE